jgi:hypothetical protein
MYYSKTRQTYRLFNGPGCGCPVLAKTDHLKSGLVWFSDNHWYYHMTTVCVLFEFGIAARV